LFVRQKIGGGLGNFSWAAEQAAEKVARRRLVPPAKADSGRIMKGFIGTTEDRLLKAKADPSSD